MISILRSLDHAPTRFAITAERALLAALEGGCQVPIGAAMMYDDSGPMLHGVIASVDGEVVVRGSIRVTPDDPTAAGRALAEQLHAQGGADILAALRS
jgi:hydroxymethylbilane synthase